MTWTQFGWKKVLKQFQLSSLYENSRQIGRFKTLIGSCKPFPLKLSAIYLLSNVLINLCSFNQFHRFLRIHRCGRRTAHSALQHNQRCQLDGRRYDGALLQGSKWQAIVHDRSKKRPAQHHPANLIRHHTSHVSAASQADRGRLRSAFQPDQ